MTPLHFCDYLGIGPGPLFEQFRIPFTKELFVPSLIEIGLLVLEKIFKMLSVFLLLCYYLPLGRMLPSFEQFRIPFSEG
jgi:hypothetical protein